MNIGLATLLTTSSALASCAINASNPELSQGQKIVGTAVTVAAGLATGITIDTVSKGDLLVKVIGGSICARAMDSVYTVSSSLSEGFLENDTLEAWA